MVLSDVLRHYQKLLYSQIIIHPFSMANVLWGHLKGTAATRDEETMLVRDP